jgi:hypothetical protein
MKSLLIYLAGEFAGPIGKMLAEAVCPGARKNVIKFKRLAR